MEGACPSGWPHMQSYSLELFCASSTHLFACFEPASLRAPSEKLWLCKSSPAPRLSLICKSRRLKWYGKARWADCNRAYKWISSSEFVACGSLSYSRSDRPLFLFYTFFYICLTPFFYIFLICIRLHQQLSPSWEQEKAPSNFCRLQILSLKSNPST